MNTEKMTVHRALAELKTIDDRISKAIASTEFCIANKHINTKINGEDVESFKSKVKDNYKSIKSLINRRNAMKRAVVLSNAITEVEINGIKYRVAEAIEMKNHGMENYIAFYEALRKSYGKAKAVVDFNSTLDKKADDYVIGLYGSKEKVVSAEADAARKAYIDANTYDIVDPIDVVKQYESLKEKIDMFNTEVDAALSVSNAITEIEFSYEVE